MTLTLAVNRMQEPSATTGQVTHPERIVVRSANWVGDAVMSIPAIRELRRIFPAAELSVWAPAGLMPLLAATAAFDSFLPFDKSAGGPLQRPLLMRARLRSSRFDLAVLLQNAFESAFTSWLAAIPLRAGFPTDLRGPLLNIRVPRSAEILRKHQVFYYLAITDFLGDLYGRERRVQEAPDCSVSIPDSELERARDILTGERVDLERPLFCLCPGSANSEAKRWPADHFARLAGLLADRFAAQIVFLGAPDERELISRIAAATNGRRCINLAGRTGLMDSLAVMRLSSLVISNDTGSAHMAVAARAPVLTLFGPTSAGATAPYGPAAHVIQGEAPCAPCRNFRCPVLGHPCMQSLTPERVLEQVDSLIS